MNKKLYASVNPLLIPVEKHFDYEIPDELLGSVRVGTMVIVPFGKRRIFGIVTRISDSAQVEQPKPIAGLVADFRSLPPDLFKLCRWISHVFLCPLNQVFEAVFPFQRRIKKYGIDKDSYIQLKRKTMLYKNVSITDKAVEQGGVNGFAVFARARARKRVLEALSGAGGSMEMGKLLEAADTSLTTVSALDKDGWVAIDYLPKSIFPAGVSHIIEQPNVLFPAQEEAYRAVQPLIIRGEHMVFLLQGVTGSGKTEIYMHLADAAISYGKRVLILVPEIAMGTQIIARFLRRFSGVLSVWHSALSMTERLYEWEKISSGRASVLVGARSAVFAPLENIGVIIVDEEQESAYKQDSAPRYHARYAAIQRAKYLNCPIVLGSATPSIESINMTRTGRAHYLYLPERIGESELPEITIVDMRKEERKHTTSTFSALMLRELKLNLERREQSLVFLNHRGYSQYVQCIRCGDSIRCDNCAVAMKYHREDSSIRCHYCGAKKDVPAQCPHCRSHALRPMGIGTEKVHRQLQRFFAEAKVERMDRDTTAQKGEYSRIIDEFEKHKIDVLVGTQMIAKGFDFPGVTFVGVVSADSIINMPDFRATERTFQLLTQVAGRAGRGRMPGRALVQTYAPLHPAIAASRTHNFEEFFNYEIDIRRKAKFPPFTFLANFIVSAADQKETRDTALRFVDILNKIIRGLETDHFIGTMGPAEAPFYKLHGKYRWFVGLRSTSLKLLLDTSRQALGQCSKNDRKIIHPDVFPENMM